MYKEKMEKNQIGVEISKIPKKMFKREEKITPESLTGQNIQRDLKIFLEKVVKNTKQHTHWLNTLAFMEHIGSRKIIKSQNSSTLDLTLLQHISEEARHAFYFKTLAHKLSPVDCPSFEEKYMIKGADSEDYFQAIDHHAEEDLANSSRKNILNYLYTTWMIEERAIMLYKLYNEVLSRTDLILNASSKKPKRESFSVRSLKVSKPVRFNLNFILQEEDHHLKTVIQIIQEKDPDFQSRKERLFNYEQVQFALLVKKWQSVLSPVLAPAGTKTGD